MRRFNLLAGELPAQQDRPGYAWRGRRGLAAESGLGWLGASVYELPDGQSPGDLVCFPTGPDGAHTVRGPGRVVLFSGVSSTGATSASVYPDSDKVGVRPPGGGPDRLNFRRGDAVDYWEGE